MGKPSKYSVTIDLYSALFILFLFIIFGQFQKHDLNHILKISGTHILEKYQGFKVYTFYLCDFVIFFYPGKCWITLLLEMKAW